MHPTNSWGAQSGDYRAAVGHRTTADIYGSLPEKVDRAAADQLDQLFKASQG